MISSESDFLKFAFNKYDKPHLNSITEFESDLKIFSYINKLINRYRADKTDLQHRLIANHIIVLGNCFTVQGAIKMSYYKILPENVQVLETFFYYLDFIEVTQEKLDFYLLDILNE
jgi:hypothetical protein